MLSQPWLASRYSGRGGLHPECTLEDRTNCNPASRSRRFITWSSHYINLVPLLEIRRLASSADGFPILHPFYTQLRSLGRVAPLTPSARGYAFPHCLRLNIEVHMEEQLCLLGTYGFLLIQVSRRTGRTHHTVA